MHSGSGYQKPFTVANDFIKELSLICTLESELTRSTHESMPEIVSEPMENKNPQCNSPDEPPKWKFTDRDKILYTKIHKELYTRSTPCFIQSRQPTPQEQRVARQPTLQEQRVASQREALHLLSPDSQATLPRLGLSFRFGVSWRNWNRL